MTSKVLGYTGELPPLRFNMAQYCLNSANAAKDKTALIVIDSNNKHETWSYRALEKAVLRVSFALRQHHALAPQSRVIIRLRNTSCYAIAFFGALAAGLIPVPASAELTARELDHLIVDSEAAAILLDDTLPHGVLFPELKVISQSAFNEILQSGVVGGYADTNCGDAAFLVYTSGTTATPKGVLHAHRSAWGRRPMYRGWYGIAAEDRLLHAGSLNWTYTLGTGLTDPWANGATAVVYTGEKDPQIWPSLIQDYEITLFAAVPGVFRQILKHAQFDRQILRRLRHGLCAGEALSQNISREWQAKTGTMLYEALGQTELSTYISFSPQTPPRPGKVGVAQPGRCVVILPENQGYDPLPSNQEGLIAVHRSDPGLMLGYWRRPQEEAEMFRGEWFVGGDAGTMDDRGYIAHLGRKNDLMNAGGFRVSPLEIESQLTRHPHIAEVAVAEITIRDGVSIVTAFIVPHATVTPEKQELERFAQRHLAVYKCPKDYILVEALPRTANGKLKRSELPKFTKQGTGP